MKSTTLLLFLARAEMFRMQNQANAILPYTVTGTDVKIEFHGMPTLIDGAIQTYMVCFKILIEILAQSIISIPFAKVYSLYWYIFSLRKKKTMNMSQVVNAARFVMQPLLRWAKDMVIFNLNPIC